MITQVSEPLEVSPTHFIKSAVAVFGTMIGCELEVGEPTTNSSFQSQHELRGIIGFTGRIQAMVVISFGPRYRFRGIQSISWRKCRQPLMQTYWISLGELANMIGGGARERLGDSSVNLGLPTAISGKDHYVSFDSSATVTHIPFSTPWGKMTIEYGIRGKAV